MRDVRFATAQFEHRDGDKHDNLARVRGLTRRAAAAGAEVVCFHECCITGYTVLQTLDRPTFASWAEPVPAGPSTDALIRIARESRVVVMAGLVEVDDDGRLFNTYVAVGPDGFIARHRKLHVFISPFLSPGDGYTVFDLGGVRVGILICYDNNLPENARATTLLGAEVIVAPHVTCCSPSNMVGRGTVDRRLWEGRDRDPARLRFEFDGPKGRGWLMRWLPARAWENGVSYIFSNPIGVDSDTIKPGLSMILDPHGEVLAECTALGDDVAVALLTAEAHETASGRRYLAARRPELYEPIVRPHPEGHRPVTKPGWALAYEEKASS